MSVVRVEGLAKSYFGRSVLDGVSFVVDPGLHLAIVGDNGTGKTTLLRILAGREEADEGSVAIAGGTVMGYLGQQLDPRPDASLTPLDNPGWRRAATRLNELEQALAETREEAALEQLMADYGEAQNRFAALGGYDYPMRLAAALAGLGIHGEQQRQSLATLSGGERMRVEMAWLLLERPDLLLLDEPTNHLDIAGMEWLEQQLQSYGGSLIYVSHDRQFIDRTAQRVAELHRGRMIGYRGDYSAYLEQKAMQQDYARQQVKQLERSVAYEREVAQTLFSHRKMSAFHAREKKVERLEAELESTRALLDSGHARLNFRAEALDRGGDPDRVVLSLRGSRHAFGERWLFRDFSAMLHYGKVRHRRPNGRQVDPCAYPRGRAARGGGRTALGRGPGGGDDGPADPLRG